MGMMDGFLLRHAEAWWRERDDLRGFLGNLSLDARVVDDSDPETVVVAVPRQSWDRVRGHDDPWDRLLRDSGAAGAGQG